MRNRGQRFRPRLTADYVPVEIEIRKMQPSDMAQVMDLLRHWNIAPMEPSAAVPQPERTALIVENTFVAVAAGRIIGVRSFIERSPTEAEGASLAVAPEYHGKGVGKKLILAGHQEMRARGIRKVIGETDRTELLRLVVRRFGARVIGTNPKRHPFGDPGIDHWTVYEIDLDAPPDRESSK